MIDVKFPTIVFDHSFVSKYTNIGSLPPELTTDMGGNALTFNSQFKIITGEWAKDRNLLKYLNFAIFTDKDVVLPSTVLKDKNYSKLNIFSYEDLIQNSDKTGFILRSKTNIYKSNIKQIDSLVHTFFCFYDFEKMSQDFSVDLSEISTNFIQRASQTPLVQGNKLAQNVYDNTLLEAVQKYFDSFNIKTSINSKKINIPDGDYFSEMFSTKDYINIDGTYKDILKFGFFFDYRRYIVEHTLFQELVKTNEFSTEYVANSKLLHFELFRERTDLFDKYKNIEPVLLAEKISDNSSTFYHTKEKTVVKQSEIASLNGLVFFHGVDTSVNDLTYGKYKYFVKLKIVDGAYKTLEDIRATLLQNLQTLIEYQGISSIPEIQNILFGTKTGNYIVEENRFNKNLSSYIPDLTDIFLYMNRVINLLSGRTIQGINKALEFSCFPITGNPDGVQQSIDISNLLIESINTILQKKGNVSAFSQSGILKAPSAIQILDIKNSFSSVYNAGQYDSIGFRYNQGSLSQPQNYSFTTLRPENLDMSGSLFNTQKLKQIVLPSKTNVPINLDLPNKNLDDLDYTVLDSTLSSFGQPDFDSKISDLANISDFKILAQKDKKQSLNFNSLNSFDFLEKNNITIIDPVIKNIVDPCDLEKDSKNSIVKLKNTKINKIVTTSLLNGGFILDKTKKSSYQIKIENTKIIDPKFSSGNINLASEYNIIEGTQADIFYILFKSVNGIYKLKEVVKAKPSIPLNIEYLCVLQKISNSITGKTAYEDVPIFNDVFIYSPSNLKLL